MEGKIRHILTCHELPAQAPAELLGLALLFFVMAVAMIMTADKGHFFWMSAAELEKDPQGTPRLSGWVTEDHGVGHPGTAAADQALESP